MLRRRELDSLKLHTRLYYNNKEVTRTMTRRLDPLKFYCKMGVAEKKDGNTSSTFSPFNVEKQSEADSCVFSIEVCEMPESIKAEVYEEVGRVFNFLIA